MREYHFTPPLLFALDLNKNHQTLHTESGAITEYSRLMCRIGDAYKCVNAVNCRHIIILGSLCAVLQWSLSCQASPK